MPWIVAGVKHNHARFNDERVPIHSYAVGCTDATMVLWDYIAAYGLTLE